MIGPIIRPKVKIKGLRALNLSDRNPVTGPARKKPRDKRDAISPALPGTKPLSLSTWGSQVAKVS